MGFLGKIFGKNKSAETIDTIASAEAALAKLNVERDTARSVITSASERRRKLLLEDASDDAILELDKEADAARLTVERADLCEPNILNRIRELQAGARRELLTRLEADLERATSALDVSIAEAIAAFKKYQTSVAAIEASGFSTSSYPPPPRIGEALLLNPGLIETWRRERERIADARYAAAHPQPIVAAPAPAPVAKVKTAPVVATISPSFRKQAPIKITGPVERGMTRIECVMNNVDYSGRQCVAGDQFDVTKQEADYLLRGAAFRFVAGEETTDEAAQ